MADEETQDIFKLFSLTGRVALVTGAPQGLGFEIARGFAQAGARVYIAGRNEERTEDAVARLKQKGLDVAGVVFDVNDTAAGDGVIDRIVREDGSLDILVNNAGIRDRVPIASLSEPDFHHLLHSNVTAPFTLSKRAAMHMAEKGWGRIIMITSLASQRGHPTASGYASSKAGLASLARVFASAYGRHGVTCNSIAPGAMETEYNAKLFNDPNFRPWLLQRIPMGRLGQPREIAGAALFLASEAGAFVNGHELVMDGGQAIAT